MPNSINHFSSATLADIGSTQIKLEKGAGEDNFAGSFVKLNYVLKRALTRRKKECKYIYEPDNIKVGKGDFNNDKQGWYDGRRVTTVKITNMRHKKELLISGHK
eukprot:1916072-Ditylum_brightwellii.AAC.1